MILFSIVITIIYLLLIGSLVYGFDKIKLFKLVDIPAKTKFSVVIPFRDEAENLPELLKSIVALKYPKHLFEVIFVNDDSDDESFKIIKKALDKSETDFSIRSNERKTNSLKRMRLPLL